MHADPKRSQTTKRKSARTAKSKPKQNKIKRFKQYLEEGRFEVEEKKETEAQSCLDRSWYSLNCSARFDLVIMVLFPSLLLSQLIWSILLSLSGAQRSSSSTIQNRQSQRLFERRNGTGVGINVQFVFRQGFVACLFWLLSLRLSLFFVCLFLFGSKLNPLNKIS